ncbi:Hypothetical protein A7982_01146 [Minicystis rosea]|nr:Hypothetical protein A7982_01146 [Minicystis rosea]
MHRLAAWLGPLLFAACAGTEPIPESPPAPPEARACAGEIAPHRGLVEIRDDALLAQAIGAPGQGHLCAGKVFEVVEPVTIHRVWNKAKPHTQLGRWWSFDAPTGTVADYRAAFAVCPEWSPLDMVTTCKLEVGARIVVGPGQSARCEKTFYPASPRNQVFVPNETKDPERTRVLVEGCSAATWP